jgi:hypothetical protein
MVKVIKVLPLPGKTISVEFSNGLSAERDIKPFIRGGISDDLKNEEVFKTVALDNLSGICWSNGFDFCADVLFELSNEKAQKLA